MPDEKIKKDDVQAAPGKASASFIGELIDLGESDKSDDPGSDARQKMIASWEELADRIDDARIESDNDRLNPSIDVGRLVESALSDSFYCFLDIAGTDSKVEALGQRLDAKIDNLTVDFTGANKALAASVDASITRVEGKVDQTNALLEKLLVVLTPK